jgi:hypothetical protein
MSMTQPKFIRRDDHPTMPVIYRLSVKGVKCETWRCSEKLFNDMLADMAMARMQRGGQR